MSTSSVTGTYAFLYCVATVSYTHLLVLDKGYDLLLLTEDVDEFCLQVLRSYQDLSLIHI